MSVTSDSRPAPRGCYVFKHLRGEEDKKEEEEKKEEVTGRRALSAGLLAHTDGLSWRLPPLPPPPATARCCVHARAPRVVERREKELAHSTPISLRSHKFQTEPDLFTDFSVFCAFPGFSVRGIFIEQK